MSLVDIVLSDPILDHLWPLVELASPDPLVHNTINTLAFYLPIVADGILVRRELNTRSIIILILTRLYLVIQEQRLCSVQPLFDSEVVLPVQLPVDDLRLRDPPVQGGAGGQPNTPILLGIF